MDGDEADTATTEKTDVKVAVLNGTTGFGMAQLMEQNANKKAANNYTFTVETVGSDIIAQLVNGSVDIAALPTNAAAAVYNRTQGGVKVIAINTLGVLYAVENGNTITSIQDLEGKTIYCPAQNPQYILEYLLAKNNINATINTEYEAPADLRTALVANQLGENAIAILPEPMVTMALNGNSSLRVALDLTAEWNAVEDTQLVQGCVVVRNEFYEKNKKAVSKFLDEYKTSIEYMQTNVDEAAKLVVKYGIFANEAVAKAAIPKCNVTYLAGADMKNAMEGFLTAMKEVAPASIGNKLPGDDFYLVTK
jgi:NitT/TauT family transport system substrate-binding protein